MEVIKLKSQKNRKEVLVKVKRTFWDDPEIGEKLDGLPDGEMSYEIRKALRQYFGITGKPMEPITAEAARLVARELMSNLKIK